MNARELLVAAADWLGWQDEDMSYGPKTPDKWGSVIARLFFQLFLATIRAMCHNDNARRTNLTRRLYHALD